MKMNIEQTPTGAILDVDGTLARFGGDRRLFRDIIGFFLEDAPPLMDELQEAVQHADSVRVRSAAHALKGLCAGCGGVRAAQAAQRVENAGAAADLEDIDGMMEVLEREFSTLRRAAGEWNS
jgi:HPt (histidine-containing phosphotransfer) domain-containing protein